MIAIVCEGASDRPDRQRNLTGFLVERFVNWRAVPGAVAYLATT